MTLLAGLSLFVATIAVMEGVAYVAHRWIMHGPGWFLHASHHRPRHGMFEANDLYAVIFALPSIVLLLGAGCSWVGARLMRGSAGGSRRTARSISASTT